MSGACLLPQVDKTSAQSICRHFFQVVYRVYLSAAYAKPKSCCKSADLAAQIFDPRELSHVLRRFLSILLVVALSLTAISSRPSLGRLDNSSVPACCRKGGRHHCLTNMSERSGTHDHAMQIGSPIEKCPYSPAAIPAVHPNIFGPPTSAAVFASLVSHPAGAAQPGSKRRMLGDWSRQKRGPPALSLF
jgi:hypothetical protein